MRLTVTNESRHLPLDRIPENVPFVDMDGDICMKIDGGYVVYFSSTLGIAPVPSTWYEDVARHPNDLFELFTGKITLDYTP